MYRHKISLLVLLLCGLTTVSALPSDKPTRSSKYIKSDEKVKSNISSIRLRAQQALIFNKSKKYNKDFCILIDLSIHSGLKRLIVWDFKQDTVAYSALVSHGCGDLPWSDTRSKKKAILSNVNGSHCSSGGKYIIGKRGYSNWGINVNYKLHGLEKTNNNAFNRQIVLHSWEVSDKEVYPNGTPEGWGCPAISNKAMRFLDPMLKASKEPVLLWVYN